MIEVIYKDEKQEPKGNEGIFSVPKNIRQIGSAGKDFRIYMEDYVYTFLTRVSGAGQSDGSEKPCLAVLTGESKWEAGVSYLFIRGALTAEQVEASAEHIEFSEEVWRGIQEEAEKYFEGQEIVGWFFAQKSLPLEATELFARVHVKHFGGGEKVLMLMDPAEREEAFFRYENNFLARQGGYYLYYEKNPQMQAYMLEKFTEQEPARQEEVQDEAVKAFRKIIQKKKDGDTEGKETGERASVFSYAATACLVLAVAAVGVRFYQNYQAMHAADERAAAVSAGVAVKEEQEEQGKGTEDNESRETATDGVKGAEDDLSKQVDSLKDAEETGVMEKTAAANGTDNDSVKRAATANALNAVNGADGTAANKTEAAKTEEAGETSETANVPTPTAIPRPTAIPKEAALSEEDQAIYREESDTRKAERRVQEAQKDSAQETGTETSGTAETSYIIRPGDTLYQISMQRYGSMDEVEEICRLNGISEDTIIYPGQIIVLP